MNDDGYIMLGCFHSWGVICFIVVTVVVVVVVVVSVRLQLFYRHTRTACVYNACLACYNLALVSAQHHMRVTWSRWCSSAWNGATRTRCRWSCR